MATDSSHAASRMYAITHWRHNVGNPYARSWQQSRRLQMPKPNGVAHSLLSQASPLRVSITPLLSTCMHPIIPRDSPHAYW
eukprot:scaffold142168_cov15-Prasinocladus_malaysianus.AAC.1